MKILITGATDGIGLATARMLAEEGHTLLLHGRNEEKLKMVEEELGKENAETYVADLSVLKEVKAFADRVTDHHDRLDVLINNAGIYKTPVKTTGDGLDIRFAVNTVAPYLLTRRLLPLMDGSGRIINLSSAAQQPVDLDKMMKQKEIGDDAAYGQSKLALTMWTIGMAKKSEPVIVAVNPMSLLGSKMVKEAFGTDGHDISIGARVLYQAAVSDSFREASGKYYDNDKGNFGNPHPDAENDEKVQSLLHTLDSITAQV